MIWLISGAVFLAALTMVLGIRALVLTGRDNPVRSTKRRVERLLPGKSAAEAAVQTLLREQSRSSIPTLDRILGGLPRLKNLDLLLQQAGSPVNLGTLVLMSATVAVMTILGGSIWGSLLLGLALAPVGAYLPLIWLKTLRKRRLAAFDEQFPEAVDLIARALRAGHSLASAMNMVSEELDDPVAGEFARTFEDYSFGKTLNDALNGLVNRVGLQDVKFFATAVMLQRETGGNLTEILDNIGHIIRERFRLMRQVKTLSAEGRLSAAILLLLAPALFVVLWVASPGYLNMLLTHPLGKFLLGAGALFQVMGILVIRRIIRLDV